MPFTDRQIAALKPKTTRYEKKEPGRTGLGIRVTPNGLKSWTFIYRFDGKHSRQIEDEEIPPFRKEGAGKARVPYEVVLKCWGVIGSAVVVESPDLRGFYFHKRFRRHTAPDDQYKKGSSAESVGAITRA